MKGLELWGGPECTVNRVGEHFGDQLALTGHHDRLSDLDHIAALRFDAVRYPLLWERVAPDKGAKPDWAWSDERLGRLQSSGTRVIAGLVHHGSGPRHTHLLDKGFASGLADYARLAAQRYPWIRDWTPVNEPVTTARFAALYGIWYPHHRDEGSFWTALLNQIDGVRFAMRAVRLVNPDALLIQPDDLGRTYATAPLRDQAGFDNSRRWAGWDLLCGRLTPHHPLFGRIAAFGLGDRLRAIADDPCPPDVIGINHYVTSDRFLDHRFRRYPRAMRGGNGRERYADVEAVRALDPGPPGIAGALREAWARYGIPIAVTEAHNGCTREEQMRWTAETWDVADALRQEGADILAVTSWALFGVQGWNTLLTAPGLYESGAFDVRSGSARPTAIASLLRHLPAGAPRHPVLKGKGWWKRPIRLLHSTVRRTAGVGDHDVRDADRAPPAPLLICGATNMLGRALVHACRHRDIAFVLADRVALTRDDPGSVEAALVRYRPWAVVNAAGFDRVDDAGVGEGGGRTGTQRMKNVAAACAVQGVHCTGFSIDPVFRHTLAHPYLESDEPDPFGPLGGSRGEGEGEGEGVDPLAEHGDLLIRTAALFTPFDRGNFAVAVVHALSGGMRLSAVGDQVISPTYLPHLADAVLDLVIDGEQGGRHLAGDEKLSWAEFARRIARACSLDEKLVDEVAGPTFDSQALLAPSVVLGTEWGVRLPGLAAAIDEFARNMAGFEQQPCPAPVAIGRRASAPSSNI